MYLTLQVIVFILYGTSQLASCSYDKNGSPDPQIRARNGHQKLLTGDAIDSWRVCGELSLSSKYKIHAAAGVQNILLYRSDSVDVAISPETGTISCKCRLLHVNQPPNVDTTNQQVGIEVEIVERETVDNNKISLPVEFVFNPCQVSFCQRNPTTLLTIRQRQSYTSEHISPQLNSECTNVLLKEYSLPPKLNVQLMSNGAVALSALPSANLRRKSLSVLPWTHRAKVAQTSDDSGFLLQNQPQLDQVCSVDVTRPIEQTNRIDANFTQLLPLELVNCISLLNDHQATVEPKRHNIIMVPLSFRPWLSDHDTLFTRHNSQRPHHAELSTASDAIHEKGGHIIAVSKSATGHGAGAARVSKKIREVRQLSTSPPEFNDTFYMGSVLENSPSGTIVITVRATGNGQIVYTMTADSGFSSSLFAMDRTTGVVTTRGWSRSSSN